MGCSLNATTVLDTLPVDLETNTLTTGLDPVDTSADLQQWMLWSPANVSDSEFINGVWP